MSPPGRHRVPGPAAPARVGRAAAPLLACLLIALGGCGGDDGGSRPSGGRDAADGEAAAQAGEAGVRRVLEDALDALFEGDGQRACSHYTDAYRSELVAENRADRSDVAPRGATCEAQVRSFAPLLRRFVPGRAVRIVRVAVRGDEATAVSEFRTTRGTNRIKEFLVRRGGRWRIDGDQEPGEPAPAPRP